MRIARTHDDAPARRPVELPDTEQHDIRARNGDAYRLLIAIPSVLPPPEGFPLVYMVDGNALFPGAVAAARLLAGRPDVTGVGPAILLGIGYPDCAAFDPDRRARDLLPDGGGADRFLDFIATEVLALVTGLAPVDPGRRALIGHSFGGLFALHALFTRPQLFGTLVAGSPSIWWNDRAILASEAAFRDAPPPPEARRLLITVGSAEQHVGPDTAPERAERLRKARMVENAREMAWRLMLTGHVGCTLTMFPDENHISVVPAMLGRAMTFVLSEPSRQGARIP